MRLTVLLITTFFSPLWLFAMTSLRSQRLTMGEGLCSNYVQDMVEDRYGMLWIGSTGGLSRFDGNSVLNFQEFPTSNNDKLASAAISLVLTDRSKRYVWARATNYCFFCYDTQTGRFLDYSGRGDQGRAFREIAFGKDGTVWLYQGDGVRRIRTAYPDGRLLPMFSCTDYTMAKGQLPYREIRKLLTTDSGGAWLGADKGLAYIDNGGRTHILDSKRKVFQTMKLGGGLYAFFMTGNRIMVGNDTGKIVGEMGIPFSFGVINRITGYACETTARGKAAVAHAFTNGGTLAVDVLNGKVTKSGKLDINEGINFGTYNGYTVVITRSGEVWILDKSLKPVAYKKMMDRTPAWTLKNVFSVTADRHGRILISARTWGLLTFNTTKGQLAEYRYWDPMMPHGCYDVCKITFDSAGNLWGATQGEGVFGIFRERGVTGKYVRLNVGDLNALTNSVEELMPEDDGSYTVSAKTGELFRYVPSTDEVTQTAGVYGADFVKQMEQTGNCVLAVCKDSYGNRWTGLTKAGIDIEGKRYHDKAYDIQEIIRDRRGRMWFTERESGLKMIPSAREYGDSLEMTPFLNANAGEKSVSDMEMDSHGRLWVASGEGLHVVDTRLRRITEKAFRHFNVANSPIPGGNIICIALQEKERRIWCGLQAGGLMVCRFNDDWTVMTACERYTVRQGLAAETVNTVLCDRHGYVWAGTDNGLSLLNSATGNIKTYRFSQRSKDNYFKTHMMRIMKDGRILCSTNGGLLVIQPKRILFRHDSGRRPAGPGFTDFHIDGESVFTDFTDNGFDDMRMSIINNSEVALNHNQNNITVFFSNPAHSETTTTSYQYYLEGFDETWRKPTSMPRADFVHLSPGTYTLHVRSLAESQWSEETTFVIRISPPWYASWFAYIIYICLLIAIGRYVYNQVKANYRLRRRLRAERQQREIERQLTDYKVNFFTNVSHEFRTPLTIIHGVTKRIKALNQQGNLKQPVDTLKRSTERMLRLVNQLMEFRRMQQGKLTLCVAEGDIITFIHNIFMDFHETAYAQDIAYDFSASMTELTVPFDASHLDKIMYNLISNAFKYSEHKGRIDVRLQKKDWEVVISVADTGIGVAKEIQPHLFDRYMESSRVVKDSLGIGLTLTAALVERHHGTITYTPNTPRGSVFTVKLPADSSAYAEDEFMTESPLATAAAVTEKAGFEQVYREMTDKPINDCTVLVVEDDADMAAYTMQVLAKFFKVLTAKNGEDALNMLSGLENNLPQLVVTDVVMPLMDGYQLTAKMRKDERYRAIPVIMLTALGQEEKYVKGIAAGADVYLNKPFSPSVLAAHAIQLVNQRMNMKRAEAKAEGGNTATVQKAVVADIRDKNFMDQVDAIINAHISDEGLSVETLTEGMGIGRSKLFEKMKVLCDMTPRDYILRHRMEYACDLLKDGSMSIAEIAYKTGFGHPPYFTRVFKKYYGVTPSEYIKK